MDYSDPFTSRHVLCDDGIVRGEYLALHNRLAWMGDDARRVPRRPEVTDEFHCTGSAHLAGEHILCTSPAHVFDPEKWQLSASPVPTP